MLLRLLSSEMYNNKQYQFYPDIMSFETEEWYCKDYKVIGS